MLDFAPITPRVLFYFHEVSSSAFSLSQGKTIANFTSPPSMAASFEAEQASAWHEHRLAISIAAPMVIWLMLRRWCSIRHFSVHDSTDVGFPDLKAPQKTHSAHVVPNDESSSTDSNTSSAINAENSNSGSATNPRGRLAVLPQLSHSEQRALEDLRANLSSLGVLERLDPYAQVQYYEIERPTSSMLSQVSCGKFPFFLSSQNMATYR
jgi:hypothetical protein